MTVYAYHQFPYGYAPLDAHSGTLRGPLWAAKCLRCLETTRSVRSAEPASDATQGPYHSGHPANEGHQASNAQIVLWRLFAEPRGPWEGRHQRTTNSTP